MKIFDTLKVSFARMFSGQRQTIKNNQSNVVAAQSKGGPATAGITVTPVIEKIVNIPKETVEEIEKKIENMVASQAKEAEAKPGGVLIDEREFNVLLRDIKQGESVGKIEHHKEAVTSYESFFTYDGIPINRIAGLGLGSSNDEKE